MEDGLWELCFWVGGAAESFAEPGVAGIAVQARVPDHLEVKWAKLFGGFDEAQGRVGFNHRTHTAGEGEHVGGAGEALQGDAEVGHTDGGAAFEAEGR